MTPKILAQKAPAATVSTLLIRVPSKKAVTTTALTLCAQTGAALVDLWVVNADEEREGSHQAVLHQVAVALGSPLSLDLTLTLSEGDTIHIKSDVADVAFGLFGYLSSVTE